MKRHLGIVVAGALALPMAACGICFPKSAETRAQDHVIGVSEVATLINRKDAAYVYDANSLEQYRQGHVPTAKWVPYDSVTKQHLPSKQDALLIFYCYNEMCSASSTAAQQARSLGYSNVRVMEAGIEGWQKAKQPTES